MNQTRCDNCLKKFGRNMQISDRTGRIRCTDCTFFGKGKVERSILKDREENTQQASQQEIETQQEKEQETNERWKQEKEELWVNTVTERRMKREIANKESESESTDNNDSNTQKTRENNNNDGRQ